MQIAKSLILSLAILLPVTSYASTVDDAVIKNVIKEHQALVSDYALGKNQTLPAIVRYQYGMKLDIAKVVRLSPDLKACGVTPQLMTYEDSKGELKTVKYQVLSSCRNKN